MILIRGTDRIVALLIFDPPPAYTSQVTSASSSAL